MSPRSKHDWTTIFHYQRPSSLLSFADFSATLLLTFNSPYGSSPQVTVSPSLMINLLSPPIPGQSRKSRKLKRVNYLQWIWRHAQRLHWGFWRASGTSVMPEAVQGSCPRTKSMQWAPLVQLPQGYLFQSTSTYAFFPPVTTVKCTDSIHFRGIRRSN